MARLEQDREDLLREATALVPRAELEVGGCSEPIVVGFRRGGGASFYFGGGYVLQFNADRALRRAYAHDLLWKAERGRLVQLRRERTPTEVALVRRQISTDEQLAFLIDAEKQLRSLWRALEKKDFHCVGQSPPEGDIIPAVLAWFASLSFPLVIAARPHATP